MPFTNEKKMYLSKQDKSKKGDIDEKVIPLLKKINAHDNYYTTSSCSGRVYLWTGTGKKNETQWLKVSHDLIDTHFFDIQPMPGVVWLRVESFILHVVCKDLDAAKALLEKAHLIYKKSCILSASNKILVEIRGSEIIEMPLYIDGSLIFTGDLSFLAKLANTKIKKTWDDRLRFEKSLNGV